MIRVGIDTGGTFTDTIMIKGDDIYTAKKPTTGDLISGVLEGFEDVCEQAGVSPEDVDSFGHGHTVATNALIEETGAETALVTTEGFRDVLEVGEAYRGATLLYNPCGEHEAPLIPRRRRYEVAERLNAAGEVTRPLDVDGAERVVRKVEASGVESVAVCLLHSYRNPAHERKIAGLFEELAPEVDVSLSSEVSPEIREYSRTATTVVDSYISPTINSYLTRLQNELEARGLSVPINVMKSDGGVARPHIVTSRPVTQTISGPVAATRAAQYIGETVGIADLMTLDMGGTSADTAMIKDGDPLEERHREIRGMKINGPFVSIDTIGAGGGSIAWLNDVNALRVGPQSAGAEPGPVCYGRGGEQPTVTDADLVLGLLNPDNFAGGELTLDEAAARRSIETQIADPLGMSVEEAAVAIRDVIDSKLASALQITSVQEGFDPRDFSLMGFGGAGPMHVCNVAAELDIDEVVFPNNPGLTSAFGLLVTDVQHNYVQSVVETVPEIDLGDVNRRIDGMTAQGTEELSSEGIPPDSRRFNLSFDMMYEGQAHHLNVPVGRIRADEEEPAVSAETLEEVSAVFEERHRQRYDFTDQHNEIEIVNVRVTAVGDVEKPRLEEVAASGAENAKKGVRDVILDEDTAVEVPFFEWAALSPGDRIDGPAIVELENSTIWIPPTFDSELDRYNNLIVTRGESK